MKTLQALTLGTLLETGCIVDTANINEPIAHAKGRESLVLDLSNTEDREKAWAEAIQFSKYECAGQSLAALEPVLSSFSTQVALVCTPSLLKYGDQEVNAWVHADGLATAIAIPQSDAFLQNLTSNDGSLRRAFDDLLLCSELSNCVGMGKHGLVFSGEQTPQGPTSYFSKSDELRLAYYPREFNRKFGGEVPLHDPNQLNRTWAGRLSDHEVFLRELPNDLDQELHFHDPKQTVIFFDIGPGIANQDLKIGDGKGKPAITSQEMAKQFPRMQVVVLDLASEVDHFTGKKYHKGYPRIKKQKKRELLNLPNIHILRGDGLAPLLQQWENPRSNPYPDRRRVDIQGSKTTVIVRAANSIDLYCDWEKETKPALKRIAEDFKEQAVLLFFNREIVLKSANSVHWRVIGRISASGFDHVFRDGGREDTQGRPYILY